MRSAPLLALLASLAFLAPARSARAATVHLTLECRDPQGNLMVARARIVASTGGAFPAAPDSATLANSDIGGYFYLNGSATVAIPSGSTHITVGRGFERTPVDVTVQVLSDTTITATLTPFVNLGASGWYAGDMHIHTQHPPIQYVITPEITQRVVQSEGLSVANLLDEDYRFTGAPDALSDTVNVLFYSYEFRNQSYGHISIPGLHAAVPAECCLEPEAPYPMNSDFAEQARQSGGLFTLAHPHTTDDDTSFCCWPGLGLGRELPVLAGLGLLDAIELASYSNAPDLDTQDWFDLLSMGMNPVPVAGTDAVINWKTQPPAGGWRVYAKLAPGAPLTFGNWMTAVRSGRTFVTSYPLVPDFSVNGIAPGGTVEAHDSLFHATVHLHAQCAISIRRIALIADGVEIWSRPWTTWPPIYDKDTTLSITLPTPGWMALRVEAPAGHPHAAYQPATAITNAVRLVRFGQPRRNPAVAAKWLTELDRFQTVIEARGGWTASFQQDTVEARVARARATFEQIAAPVLGVPARPPAAGMPRAAPNPGFGAIRLVGFAGRVEIFDVQGRKVATVPAGAPAIWDGRDAHGRLRAGLFLARSADGLRTTRFVLLR